MNDQVFQILWLLALTILALVNILAAILKKRRNNPGKYGERIAELEKGQELLDKSNEKDHKLIREDISKLFELFNEMKK